VTIAIAINSILLGALPIFLEREDKKILNLNSIYHYLAL